MEIFKKILFISNIFLIGIFVGIFSYLKLNELVIDWQLVTGIAAVIISMFALFTSYAVTQQTIMHNKLSVEPFLTTTAECMSSKVELIIKNSGYGLAEIIDLKLHQNNKVYDWSNQDDINHFIEDNKIHLLGELKDDYKISYHNIGSGMMLQSGEQCELITIEIYKQKLINVDELNIIKDTLVNDVHSVAKYKNAYQEIKGYSEI